MITCKQLKEDGVVAIAGAGPAGLTLARLLQIRGFSVRVFERDASSVSRLQGGSVDMRADSGQRALRQAGLGEVFERLARDEAKAFKMMDSQGGVITQDRADFNDETEEAGPEIDRGDLREMLLNSLTPDTVVWDRIVKDVVPEGDGRWRLEFAEGESFAADLIVGADGVRSRVRPHLTQVTPRYFGVTMLDATIREDLWRGSELDEMVGEGAVLIAGGGQTIFIQRCAHDVIRLYFSLTVAEDWPKSKGFDLEDTARVLNAVKEAYRDWSPELMAMLTDLQGGFQRWALNVMPPEHRWTTQPGLTIVGDASHVMPPFTGKGVNLALLDALELTERLTATPQAPVTEVVAAFERGTQARSRKEIAECLESGRQVYGIDLDFGSA